MDRRNFLKTAVAGVAGSALLISGDVDFKPSKPIKASEFDSDDEYGNVVSTMPLVKPTNSVEEGLVWDSLKRAAYSDMLKVVPEEYRYRVQFRTKAIDSKTFTLCWYYPRSGKHPVRFNGQDKIICYHTPNLPLPTHNELGNYGVI